MAVEEIEPTLNDYAERIDKLKYMINVQSTDGNWNQSPYMHGMANGLIIALAVILDESQPMLDAAKQYICDIDVSKLHLPPSLMDNIRSMKDGN